MSISDAPPRPTRRRASPRVLLALFATAQLMLVLDVTVVNVALPAIGTDLGLSQGALPWVMTTYTLCFGGLMLSGGRIADQFGAHRTALVGLVVFTASSALCGFAQGDVSLIVGRALQGASAAVLSPAALAAALTAFPGGERHRVMSVWSALAGTGSALGVLAGGALTAETSWRWVFGINVPIGMTLFTAIVILAPRSTGLEAPVRRSLDLPGAALITGTTASAIYGLITAGTLGWGSTRVWVSLAVSVVLGAAFVALERSLSEPLLHLEMFTRRPVIAGAALMLTATGLLIGAFFLGSFALQHAHHYSALRTGLCFLPTALGTMLGAHLSGTALSHISARVVATAGYALAAGGFAAPAMSDSAILLVGGLSVAAVGIGALFVTAFTASLGDASPGEAGLRSAVVNTFHELGGAAGVAVLSSAAGAVLIAAGPVASDFSHAFTVGAVIALVSGAIAPFLVPPVLRGAESGGHGH